MAFYNLLQLGRADLVLAGIGSVFVALPLFSLHRVTRATSGQLDRLGIQTYVDTMHRYQEAYGDQFAPAQIAIDYAKANKKFHPA